jgi:hypothetical protein
LGIESDEFQKNQKHSIISSKAESGKSICYLKEKFEKPE